MSADVYDYVIVGSGFGGSISAMRLTEKGYRVLVLEQGKRFRDQDFARTNWRYWKYLWMPAVRAFGILQISAFRHVFVMHGAGVGGGSLGYANVLMQPDDAAFAAPEWNWPHAWGDVLRPHYATARRMLGVAENPRLTPADHTLREIARDMGREATFRPTTVGAYFGEPGREVPDPYFGGEGPARSGCIHCGGCMVGCRHNAKNTLTKNYLHLAEKWGARVQPETLVRDIRPLGDDQADGARYAVIARRSTAWLPRAPQTIRARHVIVAAGALGTLRLLFRCRDHTRSLPRLSPYLGENVRTNSEALLGSTARAFDVDYSKGLAITSVFYADPVTTVQPVRYPAGSGLLKFLAAPATQGRTMMGRFTRAIIGWFRRAPRYLNTTWGGEWARRTTVLLVMQTEDNRVRMRWGRGLFTGGAKGLVSRLAKRPLPARIDIGHEVNAAFAKRTKGLAQGSIMEGLLNIPVTAHILGGVPFGADAQHGVIDAGGGVHGYPGLSVIDGSILPGNPGINPSLTIAAMAEYAMSRVASKPGAPTRPPIGITDKREVQNNTENTEI